MRLLPHLRVPDRLAAWYPWFQETNEGLLELGTMLQGWDYACDLTLVTKTQVALDEVLDQAQLSSDARVGVAVTWDCAATGLRKSTVTPITSHEPITSRVHVPAGQVAQELVLLRDLVLVTPGSSGSDLSPSQVGTRLGPASTERVQLEGHRGRFPVTPTSFAGLGRPAAAWALDVSYVDPRDNFVGASQVLVNTDHPAASAILNADSHPDLVSVLRYDLIRNLLHQLSEDEQLLHEETDWPEGSVAGVAEGLCRTFLGTNLISALNRLRTDRAAFDELLQERLQLLSPLERATSE